MNLSLYAPQQRVYVTFEDGESECVAIQDTLEREEAIDFKEIWENARHKPIVVVSLETTKGDTLVEYHFKPE